MSPLTDLEVYRTLSVKSPTANMPKVIRNINEILDLHETLLASMRQIVANPVPKVKKQRFVRDEPPIQPREHERSHSDEPGLRRSKIVPVNARFSLDAVMAAEDGNNVPISSPDDAADVARAFDSVVSQLSNFPGAIDPPLMVLTSRYLTFSYMRSMDHSMKQC